jgi:hypothetical protein
MPMMSTLNHISAFGTDQPGPTSRIATFVERALHPIVVVFAPRSIWCLTDASALVDCEEID